VPLEPPGSLAQQALRRHQALLVNGDVAAIPDPPASTDQPQALLQVLGQPVSPRSGRSIQVRGQPYELAIAAEPGYAPHVAGALEDVRVGDKLHVLQAGKDAVPAVADPHAYLDGADIGVRCGLG